MVQVWFALAVFVLPVVALGQSAKPGPTLVDIQQQYMGRKVVVTLQADGGFLADWLVTERPKTQDDEPPPPAIREDCFRMPPAQFADCEARNRERQTAWSKTFEAWNRLRRDALRVQLKLPLTYAGKVGTVVDVQLPRSTREKVSDGPPKVNALGEPAQPEEPRNPMVGVTVQFEDGLKATILGRAARTESVLSSTIPLLPERLVDVEDSIAHAAWVDKNLPFALGHALYAVAGSCVFPVTAPIETVFGSRRGRIAGCADYLDVPFLEPLTISQGRYSPEADGVVLKLKSGANKEYLLAFKVPSGEADVLSSAASSGNLLAAMPSGLKPFEVDAIRTKLVLSKGLSRRALAYMWGAPETENDYGRGGKQLIYKRFFSNVVYVYLDQTGVVSDWQEIRQQPFPIVFRLDHRSSSLRPA